MIDEAQRVEAAVRCAAELLASAQRVEREATRAQRRARMRIRAVIADADAQRLTLALTDEVLRITDRPAAARRFREIVTANSLHALPRVDRWLLRTGARVSRLAPWVVMRLVAARLRRESASMIVDADDPGFADHLRARAAEVGLHANVNVLGEAVLGQDEARRRLEAVIARAQRADVNFVSVKISAICATVSVLAFDATIDIVASALVELFRAARDAQPITFVNLDMEEYRDLELTSLVFRRVLDEPEFTSFAAGIVVQAYLPEAHAHALQLCEWAAARVKRGGAPIRIRVVKGANLAMELVEAEIHGWIPAPFATKADVDASYKRLLDLLLAPEFDHAVNVGVASHNIFDIAWALVLREELRARDAADRLRFEMLEGMAPAQARAVRDLAGSLLLYTPVVSHDDFGAAIAYLVRRLDENTHAGNFLTTVFDIEAGNDAFLAEETKFRAAVAARFALDVTSRRAGPQRSMLIPANAPGGGDAFRNEPDSDVAVTEQRTRLVAAVSTWEPSHAPTLDGASGTVLADDAAVELAVSLASEAQPAWEALGWHRRAELIERVGDVIATHRVEIVAAMAHDSSKTIGESDPEVSEAIDFARYYAHSAREAATFERPAYDPNGAVSSRPLGTVLVTPPWNFPYAIPMGGVLAALAAGNCVILKPAPQTIMTASLVARHIWEAGIDPSVFQFVPCPDGPVGQSLVTHPLVDAVILTGSRDTAQRFLEWKPTLRLHAETSGKNAMIITASADLDLAIRDLVRSAFGHSGQKCSAVSLAIVEGAIYDDPRFYERLADAVRTLRVGQPWDPATDIGPLVDVPSGPLLRALTQLDPGESWLVEPRSWNADERCWSPGVRAGVAADSWLAQTECFGPVLALIRADDLDHAIQIANSTPYGLSSGLHTLSELDIETWTERIEAGNLYVNRATTGAIVGRQPFGGWKASVVGPTVKAGGPGYVASLRHWNPDDSLAAPAVAAVAVAFADWADIWLAGTGRPAGRDIGGLAAEANMYRVASLPLGVAVRVAADTPACYRELVVAAAAAARCEIVISEAALESDTSFAERLGQLAIDRVRLLGAVETSVRVAAHRRGLPIYDEPPISVPAIEMLRWTREQSISRTLHRHGNLPRSARSTKVH